MLFVLLKLLIWRLPQTKVTKVFWIVSTACHSLVFHAEGVHINNACLVVAQDVVKLHIESISLLPEHIALCLHVLQLVCHSLNVVLHLFHLEKQRQVEEKEFAREAVESLKRQK